MNVLIVEDETMARRKLASTLTELYPDIRIVGETGSVSGTIEWLGNPDHKADIIFMDVALRDKEGLPQNKGWFPLPGEAAPTPR